MESRARGERIRPASASSRLSQIHKHPPLIEALRASACYDHAVGDVRIVETHISWILLTGSYAYKIKKPVKLPFLDFSTLELRRRYCDEELRLNRRLAEELYLDVVPIGGSEQAPRVGAEPAIEYAVKMRQFPERARLDHQLRDGAVDAALVTALAERIAAFHLGLPSAGKDAVPVDAQIDDMLGNQDELESAAGAAAYRPRLARIRRFVEAETRRLRPLMAARLDAGAYKEVHGDLHLENLVRIGDAVVAFDALEFDARLRRIDVVSEVAFLVMDFIAHGAGGLGYLFLNRYLEIVGDYPGLAVLRLYLVYRATVRAKVRALDPARGAGRNGRPGMADYVAVAVSIAAASRPVLLITHGLSASGKTTVGEQLIGPLRAVRIRSDLERKRRHGIAPTASSGSGVGSGMYSRRETEMTYQELAGHALSGIEHGINVIVDAAFLKRRERDAFRRLAETAGADFRILHCDAPPATLRARIRARATEGNDASEADEAVLDFQLREVQDLDRDELGYTSKIDTTSPGAVDALLDRLRSER